MKRYFIIGYCWLVALFSACGDGEEIDVLSILEDERVAIREYLSQVSSPMITIPKYSRNGQLIDSLYIFNYTEAAGKPAHGNYLLLDYSIRRLDGTCEDSTFPDRDALDSLYVNGGPIYHWVSDSARFDYYADAARAIGAKGSTCEMLVPSQLTDLSGTTHVWQLSFYTVIEDLLAYEKQLIDSYVQQLASNTLETFQDVQGDTVTTYTLVTKEATGDRLIQEGDSLTYSCTVHLLDEVHMSDSLRKVSEEISQAIVFNPAQTGTPAGFLQGIQHLKAGNEAEIIIPYAMAYGAAEQRTTNGKRIKIPSFSTLVYRVKVEKVVAAATTKDETL